MEIKQFENLLKGNNFLFLDDDWIIFNDFELYNRKKDKSIENKTLDELLTRKVREKTIKELIEEKDNFYFLNNGGNGSSSGETIGFGNAPLDGTDRHHKTLLNAELNLNTSKGNNIDYVLDRFKKKYGKADREYGIAVDEEGFTHQHIEGGRHAVAISGDKGQTIIHNHPSGSNFSKADLLNTASTKAKGIIATSSNEKTKGTYEFYKNENFKAKEFTKGINKAKWDKNLGYNKGADQWLKKNQKKYGYKYKSSGVKNANW